jgi:hypothetical protein
VTVRRSRWRFREREAAIKKKSLKAFEGAWNKAEMTEQEGAEPRFVLIRGGNCKPPGGFTVGRMMTTVSWE